MSESYPDTTYSPTPHTPQGLEPPSLGCPQPIHLLHPFCCVPCGLEGCRDLPPLPGCAQASRSGGLGCPHLYLSVPDQTQLVPESLGFEGEILFQTRDHSGSCIPKSCIQCCLFLGFDPEWARHPRCMAWRLGASSPG